MISKGDLVVMIRGHNCLLKLVGGIPFTVTTFLPPTGSPPGWYCSTCGMLSAGPAEVAAVYGGVAAVPISWLLRIPPPSELRLLEEKEPQEFISRIVHYAL